MQQATTPKQAPTLQVAPALLVAGSVPISYAARLNSPPSGSFTRLCCLGDLGVASESDGTHPGRCVHTRSVGLVISCGAVRKRVPTSGRRGYKKATSGTWRQLGQPLAA